MIQRVEGRLKALVIQRAAKVYDPEEKCTEQQHIKHKENQNTQSPGLEVMSKDYRYPDYGRN